MQSLPLQLSLLLLWITASAAGKVGHEDRLSLSFALPEDCVALFVVILHRGTGPALSDVMLEIAIVVHKLSNPNSALIVHFNEVLLALAACQQICGSGSPGLLEATHSRQPFWCMMDQLKSIQLHRELWLCKSVAHGQS